MKKKAFEALTPVVVYGSYIHKLFACVFTGVPLAVVVREDGAAPVVAAMRPPGRPVRGARPEPGGPAG